MELSGILSQSVAYEREYFKEVGRWYPVLYCLEENTSEMCDWFQITGCRFIMLTLRTAGLFVTKSYTVFLVRYSQLMLLEIVSYICAVLWTSFWNTGIIIKLVYFNFCCFTIILLLCNQSMFFMPHIQLKVFHKWLKSTHLTPLIHFEGKSQTLTTANFMKFWN